MQARLAAGQHADVIVELERLTREHPYREELRALHMIALYRSGRQADALRAYQATRDVLGEELGIVPSPRLRRLEEQILLQDPDLDAAPRHSDVACRRADGSRTRTSGCAPSARPITPASSVRTSSSTASSVASSATRGSPPLVGPSGSGKSSVVQAGLVPRLRRDHPDVLVALMQPGSQPYAVLEAALGSAPRRRPRALARGLARGTAVLLEGLASVLRDGRVAAAPRRRPVRGAVHDGRCGEASRFLALLAGAADDPDGRVPRARHVARRLLRSAAWRIRASGSCSPTTSSASSRSGPISSRRRRRSPLDSSTSRSNRASSDD